MKISELQKILQEHHAVSGDLEISFMMTGREDMVCEIDVDIALGFLENEPFLGFILEHTVPHNAVYQ